MSNKQELDRILDSVTSTDEDTMMSGQGEDEEREEEDIVVVEAGFCIECGDQPETIRCHDCGDTFCDVCFQSIHRRGSRRQHKTQRLVAEPATVDKAKNNVSASTVQEAKDLLHDEDTEVNEEELQALFNETKDAAWFRDRAQWIPLRLTYEERKQLHLIEAALKVSDYTDRVDVLGFGRSKAKRIHTMIHDICAILSGLLVACDYNAGQKLIVDRTFADNEEFFQNLFEIGRRYKIMNPEKMRSTYGKLVYLLMDSRSKNVQPLLGFTCVSPIKTVYRALEEHDNLALLDDPLINAATMEIIDDKTKHRSEIQRMIKTKNKAVKVLARKYAKPGMDSEAVERCIYSIGDNHSYLTGNRDPVDYMITYLRKYFNPDHSEEGFSLAIAGGRRGARLTHSHSRQFAYVLQSLTLWREIANDMFRLWMLAETDLFGSEYRMADTGQGLQRVQAAPKCSAAMRTILNRAQSILGSWVGSSVIHMGDHNVPNALMFIDKYTQVCRILNPVHLCISKLAHIAQEDEGISTYIDDHFGGVEMARKTVLSDFFRHAFDGSGADNFFDAGSCIDGRLTSAWNWCSQVEKKDYYNLFLLSGFVGFDGDFQQ